MVKVKILKVDNESENKYFGGIYEAFKMEYDTYTDYAVKLDKNILMGFRPEQVEEVVEESTQGATEYSTEEKSLVKKILLVEDGSVDVDDLEEQLGYQGIKVVVYRQNSNKPEFLDC